MTPGEQLSFRGAVSIYNPGLTGDACRALWPLGRMTVSFEKIVLHCVPRRYEFSKQQISSVRLVGLFLPHFRIFHARTDVPSILLFQRLRKSAVIRALHYFRYNID
jgi:hypothetical protein